MLKFLEKIVKKMNQSVEELQIMSWSMNKGISNK